MVKHFHSSSYENEALSYVFLSKQAKMPIYHKIQGIVLSASICYVSEPPTLNLPSTCKNIKRMKMRIYLLFN